MAALTTWLRCRWRCRSTARWSSAVPAPRRAGIRPWEWRGWREQLAGRGRALGPGDLVITGGLTSAHPLEPGHSISASFGDGRWIRRGAQARPIGPLCHWVSENPADSGVFRLPVPVRCATAPRRSVAGILADAPARVIVPGWSPAPSPPPGTAGTARREGSCGRARASGNRGRLSLGSSSSGAGWRASLLGHHIHRPMSRFSAVTSTERTTMVSSSTPNATAKPISARTPPAGCRARRTSPASTRPGRGDHAAGGGQADQRARAGCRAAWPPRAPGSSGRCCSRCRARPGTRTRTAGTTVSAPAKPNTWSKNSALTPERRRERQHHGRDQHAAARRAPAAAARG